MLLETIVRLIFVGRSLISGEFNKSPKLEAIEERSGGQSGPLADLDEVSLIDYERDDDDNDDHGLHKVGLLEIKFQILKISKEVFFFFLI